MKLIAPLLIDGKSWAERIIPSCELVLSDIQADSFLKKIFNLLSNDLQGILKKVGNPYYSFEFVGGLNKENFSNSLVQLLLDNNFLEERWNKKQFKIDFEQWLTEQPEHDVKPLDTKVFLTYNEEIVRLTYQLAGELQKHES